MLIRRVSVADVEAALAEVDKVYAGNLRPYNLREVRGGVRLQIKVQNSRGAGARYGAPHFQTGKQRAMGFACWHVHGTFYDELLGRFPKSSIVSGGNKVNREGGNWHDIQVGSQAYPFAMSEACECDNGWSPSDAWRGHEYPPFGVAGCSDCGTWGDSPAGSEEADAELSRLQQHLSSLGFHTSQRSTRSSNVFMVKRWLVCAPSQHAEIQAAANAWLTEHDGDTRLIHDAVYETA